MSNLLTSAVISKETLLNFENSLAVANRVSWQYSEDFAKPEDKIGNSKALRKPINVVATDDNMSWNATNSQLTENNVTLFVNRTLTVPMSFSEGDLSLKVEKFSERFIKKAATTIAAKLDLAIANSISNSTVPGANAGAGLGTSGLNAATAVPNAAGYVVGTFGTPLTTATIAAAKVVLQNQGCPTDDGDLYGILSTDAQADLVQAQATLFNPLTKIDETYRNGFIGKYNGIEFAFSQSLANHTNGAQGTLAVTAAAGNTIASGWAETATLTVTATGAAVNAGDMFVSTVYLVNPLNKVVTPTFAMFQVVTAANAGATSIVVSPAPISAGPYQNISAPIASTTLTLVGAANATGVESLIFHKQAIECVSPELTIPKKSSMDMAEIIKDDADIEGFKIRFLRGYDMIGASTAFGGGVGTGGPGFISRFDVIYGVKTVNPAWIVRVRR